MTYLLCFCLLLTSRCGFDSKSGAFLECPSSMGFPVIAGRGVERHHRDSAWCRSLTISCYVVMPCRRCWMARSGRSQNQGYPKPMVVSRGWFSIPIVGWWRVCLKIMHTYLIGISSQGPGWAGEAIKKKLWPAKFCAPFCIDKSTCLPGIVGSNQFCSIWVIFSIKITTGWWFGTFFIFPYIGKKSSQLTKSYFSEGLVETTNQMDVYSLFSEHFVTWPIPPNGFTSHTCADQGSAEA